MKSFSAHVELLHRDIGNSRRHGKSRTLLKSPYTSRQYGSAGFKVPCSQLSLHDAKKRSLSELQCGFWDTEKSFRNLIKSTRNQTVFTISRLIWNSKRTRPFGFNKISKSFLRVSGQRFSSAKNNATKCTATETAKWLGLSATGTPGNCWKWLEIAGSGWK